MSDLREKMSEEKRKAKAIIVGGSIAGLSCAHALISAGWDVLVLEKSSAPPKGSPTGAGVGLDNQTLQIIESWLPKPQLLQEITLPLTIDQNQTKVGGGKGSRILTRDENFNFRAAHWADLHGLLYDALPPEIFFWGHKYLSFCISEDKATVNVKAKVLQTEESIEINGDLLVAADGCLSSIRKTFLPDLKLRFAAVKTGDYCYCAWRGVLEFSGNESSETISCIRKAYPDLGKCLYFDLSAKAHSVFYELIGERLNWIWYVHQPEPDLKRNSVTVKVSSDMIKNMHQEAEKVCVPELAKAVKDTKEPFMNVIYDCDPLEHIFWYNVVLIGDAAHPTTPHCVRSTNMSILDAAVLGKCIKKWGAENLASALKEYQNIRLPVTSKQVLHSRRVGRIKQGLALPDHKPFDLKTASPEDFEELQQKNMPFFASAPLSVD
ncbi:unnamed protein product [Dovyalis caffra]|uniref:FAD-binding domain-containing protein n=1 Tax=Dovyalis caffra TaxID=77055 RepID=A0AAV1SNN6_9ROSI|nr:unnamed protein product [Dovyalis caffra]